MDISVAIVEDDARFMESFRRMLAATPDLKLVTTADDLAGGMKLLDGEATDVLLVDLDLPGGSGLQIIAEARRRWPESDVMVVTVFGDRPNLVAALKCGASGYLHKDRDPNLLADQIRAVRQGGSPISPSIAKHLLDVFHELDKTPLPVELVKLTPQEKNVLKLANKGNSYEEIANYMSVSHHTVQTYVKRIYRKLQVNSKAEAIYEAQRLGIRLD
jgi:DNA-binding NarL/FixJ family response regulator